jgi:uncharacterized protein with HEPN domain
MNKRDESLLQDMSAYAVDAIELLGDLDANSLLGDKRTQYAVVRAVEVVGEAASKVSPETRATLTDVPWRQVVGMRNILIHGYTDLDLALVVKVVRAHLPNLIALIAEIIGADPP